MMGTMRGVRGLLCKESEETERERVDRAAVWALLGRAMVIPLLRKQPFQTTGTVPVSVEVSALHKLSNCSIRLVDIEGA